MAVLCILVASAEAVVIVSGDGSGNTTAPGDDPGFGNVGVLGSGGAVYLGNRWILTVAHLNTAGGEASFGGINYGFLSGTDTRLENAPGSGLTGVVDLRMIRLDGEPSLPAVTIASAAPSVGENLVMIGRGNQRDASETYWSVDTVNDPDLWTEVTPPPPADQTGFNATGVRTIRWGDNEVLDDSLVVDGGFGDTQSFSTQFDSGGFTHEGQAVAGDSGGGVFSKSTGSWELIGIMHTIGTAEGQPGGASGTSAVFGNTTNSADLSAYAEQINAIVTTPEPSSSSLLALACLTLCLRRHR